MLNPDKYSMSPQNQRLSADIAGLQQNQNNLTDTAGSAGMMSGHPVLMGAGLGLKYLSAAEKRKQQERILAAKMSVARLSKMQGAHDRLANTGPIV